MDPHLISLETGTYFDSCILSSFNELTRDQFELNEQAGGSFDITLQEILQHPINLN